MNNYAVITYTDGNFLIRSEHATRESAIIAYDQLHAALINDSATKIVIKAVDSQLDVIDGKYWDVITHNVQPTPEPTPEPTEE